MLIRSASCPLLIVLLNARILAGNARSTKINQGSFLLIFSLTENIPQCRFMIGKGSDTDKYQGLLCEKVLTSPYISTSY